MGTQFSMMVFGLLWGVPYLVSAQQLTPSAAGVLITRRKGTPGRRRPRQDPRPLREVFAGAIGAGATK